MHRILRSIRTNIRELLSLASTHGGPFVTRRFLAVVLLVLTASILTPLGPLALKLIIDGLTGQAPFHGLGIGFATALYIASQWLSRSVDEARDFVYARAERRMFTGISGHFFAHVLQLPFSFHSQRATGGINQVRENGLQGIHLIARNFFLIVLPIAVQLVAMTWILFRVQQPTFVLIFCATIVCYAVTFGYCVMRVMSAANNASEAQIDASALMSDCIANYETVKLFTAERTLHSKVHERLTATEELWITFHRNYAFMGLVAAALFAAFLAVVVVFAAREVSAARMTVGEFVLINSFMLQLIYPIELLGYAVQGISEGAALLQRMRSLLREKTEDEHLAHRYALLRTSSVVRGVESAPATACHAPALVFAGVSVSYAPDRPALRDVSFVLPVGKTLGIVGASGSGKTTVVRLLMRLIEPTTGTILIDGINASELSPTAIRRAIAVVPQDTLLFNETIGYNIGFGKFGSSQEEIERAAKLARLHDFIRLLPDGYRTPVGERGVMLSGGEKQRVSIARAALKEPRLYVFDEATSSLDSTTERQIMENLREISRLRTTLIIAHRLSTVVHADEIIVLEAGAVLERGTHAELLRNGGKYSSLWATQRVDLEHAV